MAALGDAEALRRQYGDRARLVDLRGRLVIPGLIDSHIHALRAGLTWTTDVHWENVASLQDGFALIRDACRARPPGTWVRVTGGWHFRQLREARLPTVDELTHVAPHHPVWVQHLYDAVVLNRAAMERLGPNGPSEGILRGFPDIWGYGSKLPRPALEEQIRGTQAFLHELNRYGLTALIDAGGFGQEWPRDYAAIEFLYRSRQLSARVFWWMYPPRGQERESIETFLGQVQRDPDNLWYRPLGIGEQPYHPVFDGDGLASPPPVFSADTLAGWHALVQQILAAGWRLTVHACRNQTAKQLLASWEALAKEWPLEDRRLSFNHLEDVDGETVTRLQAIGAGIAIQHRAAYWNLDAFRNPQQAQHAPPLRMLWESRIPLGAGTDAAIATHYNPFHVLSWMVTGRAVGHPVRHEEHLTREEALTLYTSGSAWFSQSEHLLGRLAVGRPADFAILNQNYFTVPEDTIRDLYAVATWVDGRPVFWDASHITIPGL
ncbi:MAG: amidohydrolase family protein [Firmicutes bacterium]|nr:amidohydrolase family protein [Bacillota bacterium]